MTREEAISRVLEVAERAVGQGMGITGDEEEALDIVRIMYGS